MQASDPTRTRIAPPHIDASDAQIRALSGVKATSRPPSLHLDIDGIDGGVA